MGDFLSNLSNVPQYAADWWNGKRSINPVSWAWNSLPGNVKDTYTSGARALVDMSTPASVRDYTTSAQDTARSAMQGDGWGTATGGLGMVNAALGAIPIAGMGVRAAQKVGMGVADAGEALGRRIGFRAYHGSPHGYDKVDLSKVGTGEGAQAFGHGYYAADLESLGKTYRDQTSAGTFKTANGAVFNPQRELQALPVRVAANRNGTNLDATIERARQALDTVSPNARPLVEADLALLERLKAEGGISPNPGHMYEVQINADKASMLDWDKPISQQTPEVQRALMNLPTAHKIDPDMTGSAFYESTHLVPGDVTDKKQASEALRRLGIPGIQYLDGGSRAAGEGSRNYVVFDDSLIEILRKYGLLPVAGGAAAYGATQTGEPQPQGLF